MRRWRSWTWAIGSSALALAVLAGCGPTAHHAATPKRAAVVAEAPPPSPVHLVPGIRGYKPISFDRLRLWVPYRYTILGAGEAGCVTRAGTVVGGTRTELRAGCPRRDGGFVRLRRHSGPARGKTSTINGYRVLLVAPRTYVVPALGAQIRLQGSVPARVLQSVGPSPLDLVVAPGPKRAIPAGWRPVTYRGVQVDVPPDWPVVSSEYVGQCGSPFSGPPRVFVGPAPAGAPSCPPPEPGAPVGRDDGVWISPGRADNGAVGWQIDEETGSYLVVSYKGQAVTIGVGQNPVVARAVLHSLSYHPEAATTPIALACERVDRTEPAAGRLTVPRNIDGIYGIRTVRPGDTPAMGAAAIWRRFLASAAQPGLTYQLLLARYVVQGTPTLVWIIVGTGARTPAGNCGGGYAGIFDATTGLTFVVSETS